MLALLLLTAAAGVTLEPLDDEYYAETYSWMADLDDGTYVLAQMFVSNIGPGDGNAACRVIVVPPKGAAMSDGKTYDEDEWSLERGVFTVGPCRFELNEGATMRIVTKALTLDLATTNALVPTWPTNGQAKVVDGAYKVELLSAAHDVIVKIAGTTKRGRGFMNHSHSNLLPADVARRWVRFRAVRDDPVILHVRLPPGRGAATGFVWKKDREFRVVDAKIAQRGEGTELAFRALIESAAGRYRVTTAGAPMFRDAPLEQYGWLGALLGSLLGNPVTYTYRARLEQKGGATIDGVAEIALIR